MSVEIIGLSVNPWHMSVMTFQLSNIKGRLYHFANFMLCDLYVLCECVSSQLGSHDTHTVLFLYMSKCFNFIVQLYPVFMCPISGI